MTNPTDCDNCKFKDDRNVQKWKISAADNDEDEDEDNVYNLTKKELKGICLTYHLPRSGNKPDLIARIVSHLESFSNDETDVLQYLDAILENDN